MPSPGTEMAYSNTGWRLAQRVLEARLGIAYAQAVDRLMAEFACRSAFL
jgi:CubicO group peptidase (beta-lactamase class C family)